MKTRDTRGGAMVKVSLKRDADGRAVVDVSDDTDLFLRGEVWGSNPRPSEPQSDALTN